MRAQGEGSITRRSDGRWMAAIQIGGRRQYVYGKSKSDVAQKLADLQQAGRMGRWAEPSRLSLAEYLAEWLSAIQMSVRPTTLENYRRRIRTHVVPSIGSLKLQSIRPLHLVRLYGELARQGLSAGTVNLTHRTLRKAFADACKWRLLSANPAAGVDAPQSPYQERLSWTREEAQRFLATCQQFKCGYDPLWIFLLGTGCRRGEALGLTWMDLDLDSAQVRVERSVAFAAGTVIVVDPKSQAGRRTLVLPGSVREALLVQSTRHNSWRSDPHWVNSDSRVFVTRLGTTPQPSNLRRAFRATCRAAGVPEIRIHDLRHVHATLAIRAGADPKSLQRRLGHASLSMTLGLYTHALMEGDRATVASFEKLLASTRETSVRDADSAS